MNGTNVSSSVLERLSSEWDRLTPEAQKAARFVLENPTEVGVSTVREIAEASGVKPNTVVRMARQVGFEGYEDFREPFREAIRQGAVSYPDRVRWLQDISRSGDLGGLYADMIGAVLSNVEEAFAGISVDEMEAAARTVWTGRTIYTVGVGMNNAVARAFTYLASTGMPDFHALPRAGSAPVDDIAFADERDVLIAITCTPFRAEVVECVEVAREQGMRVIAISDSPASPIVRKADHAFVVPVETPQFIQSSVANLAVLETLLSFVVAMGSDEIVDRVESFHNRRYALGLYLKENR